MILCTSTFTRIGKIKRSELQALLFSILFSLVFLTSFAFLYEHDSQSIDVVTPTSPVPPPPVEYEFIKPSQWPDPNDKFRVVPEAFARIDFKNRRYGRYTFGGQKLNLVLTDGEQDIPNKEGGGGQWFLLDDVFYRDVTGDEQPEAIVKISHLQCEASCDGGAALLYIYERSKDGLRSIWEYETGSMADGCGLKSFIVTQGVIGVEMFGQCWEPASAFEGAENFEVRDTTLSIFRFNGSHFIKDRTKITAAPVRNVKMYIPEVLIEPL